jgi:hypothetical protein
MKMLAERGDDDPASPTLCYSFLAGWSSLVARWAHNPKVGGSNPPPATNSLNNLQSFRARDLAPFDTKIMRFLLA